MNNEINVRTLCTGIKTSEPITKELSHNICQTRLITRRLVLAVFMLETLKLSKAQFKRRTFHVPNLIPIWVDPND